MFPEPDWYRMRSVVLVSLLAALISQLAPKMALAGPDSSRICASAIHAAELSQRLPRFLLHAVSLAESGRWDKKAQARIAWPWTVTAGGKGKFFPTKAKALAAHVSQVPNPEQTAKFLREGAALVGARAGFKLGESFKYFWLGKD